MSEWFKEHDWKSCVRLKRTGGSNPLLCATKKRYLSRYLFFCRLPSFEEDLRVGAANGSERFALQGKTTLCLVGKMDN